jgi:mannitol-specific phosphotransferase system IIBC component
MCQFISNYFGGQIMKQTVQRVGRSLSAMLMPNLGAFIAWGLITALFIPAKIVFACDAGMGSSAMGATKLRKKLQAAGLREISVVHSPVSEVPADADIIVCHKELKERAESANSKAHIVAITDFLAAPEYDTLIQDLRG